jgi:carboxypeptidase T
MYKILVLKALMLISITSTAQQEIYSRIKINMRGKDIRDIARLGLEADHGMFMPNFFLINEYAESEIQKIKKAGFDYEILEADLEKAFHKQNISQNEAILRGPLPNTRGAGLACNSSFYPYNTPKNYREGAMGGYFRYEEMLAILDSMQQLYPNLITLKKSINDTLKTAEGRPLYWLRISDNPNQDETTEPEVLYTALHHAREPNSLSQLLFYMWYLLENYATNPEIKYLVDNTQMYFIPCINPDGYVYNQTTTPNGGGFWRKNRRLNSDGTYGVDLNRNYGFIWGRDDIGSSGVTSNETYRGTAPFSEPETRLIKQFCGEHQFQLAFNYHTISNVLVYPSADNGAPTADDIVFKNFSQALTRENGYKYGTALETVGYSVNGASDEWMYNDIASKPKIISLTPEVGPPYFGFWPPRTAIDDLNKMNLLPNLTMAHLPLNYGILTDNTSLYIPLKTGKINYNLKRYGFKSGALQVTLRGVSANVLSTNMAKSYTLKQFETIDDGLDFTLKNDIKNGEEVTFVLSVSNGLYTKNDTIRKVFGVFNTLFQDNCSDLDDWTRDSLWNVTGGQFKSPSGSITDSPSLFYKNNSKSNITSKPVLLPANASKIIVRYWAEWDIENYEDYAMPLISTDGTNFSPICGNYTRASTNPSVLGQPVYNGTQYNWVQEEIDITAFAGKRIWWRFALITNASRQADGFYFDDFEILVSIANNTAIPFLSDDIIKVEQNQPNPAQDFTIIKTNIHFTQNIDYQLIIMDILGREVYKNAIQTPEIQVNTEGYQAGIYTYQIEINGRRTRPKKMVISKY